MQLEISVRLSFADRLGYAELLGFKKCGLRLTLTKPKIGKQEGAIEKVLFLAQVEIGKLLKSIK